MNSEKVKQVLRVMRKIVKDSPRFNIHELRIIIALERAIARLSIDPKISEHLIFKGGFVLLKSYESIRFTRDADALAVSISQDKLQILICKALEVDLEDGLWFGDIQVQELTEQGEYGALRFDCAFAIGEPEAKKIYKLSRIHLDIGFSDRLPQLPINQIMPSILSDEEPITWKIYPIEYIVAEKTQTLFDRGSGNSRAKDIYDLSYLFPRCKNSQALTSAIQKTFENRGTVLPDSFVKQAIQFDKTVLTHAWSSVRLPDQKLSFEQSWEIVLQYLKKLDLQINF